MNQLLSKYPEEINAILAKYPPDRKRSAVMPLLSRNHYVADVVGIIGSIDIVLGDCDR